MSSTAKDAKIKQAITDGSFFQSCISCQRITGECNETGLRTTGLRARVCSLACRLRVVAIESRRSHQYGFLGTCLCKGRFSPCQTILEPADPIHGGQSFGSLPSNIAQLTLSYAIFGDIHGYLWARADVPRMRGSKRLGGCEACASYPHFEICINNDST
jgi:hypothetical protein